MPRKTGQVKVFTCGPSIYRRPHIGNYRTFLYEDILIRYLKYCGYQVDRAINFTDLEDKTIEESLSQERSIQEITSDVTDHFYRETRELRILLPKDIPTSSTSVPEAVRIISLLIKKGHAYYHGGDVFFDPLTYPQFGRLYGLDMSRWPKKKVRFRKDTYNGNRWNLGDFILWHADRGEHVHFWDTAIGRGRPAWNVQDPAMILKNLGEQVDINCGGIDNIYRHHDYNIAIMETATGKDYARYYLHGGSLVVNGQTMAKSRGNILYPEDVYGQGYSPEELRFFLTGWAHYRKKLNYTLEAMEAAAEKLRSLRRKIATLLSIPSPKEPQPKTGDGTVTLIDQINPQFQESMDEDLCLKGGIDKTEKLLEELVKAAPQGLEEGQRRHLLNQVKRIDTVVGGLLHSKLEF